MLGSLFSAACPGLGLAGSSSLALGLPWSAVATSLSAATLALKDGDAASYAIFSIGGLSLLVSTSAVAETRRDFICATLDWWPESKCDYGRCAWSGASVLNLDLSSPDLKQAVKNNKK